jgi:acetylornithine/N-succinyldiaminopimelate aminotransferase
MTAEVADTLAPGMHGTTFGGNPVCCAAANWALAQVTAPGFLAHARAAGDELARGLAQLAAKHASVREVRGLGLLRAIDLQPAAGFGPPELVAAAREHGLLIIRGGDHAVRVLPPLNVSTTDINDALTKLDASLAALESTAGGSK